MFSWAKESITHALYFVAAFFLSSAAPYLNLFKPEIYF